MKNLKKRIKQDEGYVDKVYKDSVGVLTCGWGHALPEGSKISKEIAELFFEEDFAAALTSFQYFISKYHLSHLSRDRKCVLINMLFNLGFRGLSKFKRFISAMQDEDYDKAAYEMLDSKWHKQVKGRADRLAKIMRKGVEVDT